MKANGKFKRNKANRSRKRIRKHQDEHQLRFNVLVAKSKSVAKELKKKTNLDPESGESGASPCSSPQRIDSEDL